MSISFSKKAKIITASLLLAASLPALAAIAKLDNAKSKVTIVFKQMNVPVDAQFKKFSAAIDYNTAKPEASTATVDIDVASFDLGDPQYNAE
ncbi:YceI family protein, partial [Undibacterium sp. RTI2.1]